MTDLVCFCYFIFVAFCETESVTFGGVGRSFTKGGLHSGRVTLEAIGELLQRRDMVRGLYMVLTKLL